MSRKGEEGVFTETAADGSGVAPAQEQDGDRVAPEQAAGPEEGSPDEAPSEDCAARVAALERTVTELKDQLLRRQADLENFRKRMLREKEEGIVYANQLLLLDVVTTIDDFERAIESAEASQDFDAFHSGVVLIERQLMQMLENKWGLARFGSLGEAFDPNRHQAIATEESAEVETPTVVEDYQKGYLLHDRVLRPARVKVTQPGSRTDR